MCKVVTASGNMCMGKSVESYEKMLKDCERLHSTGVARVRVAGVGKRDVHMWEYCCKVS